MGYLDDRNKVPGALTTVSSLNRWIAFQAQAVHWERLADMTKHLY
jgi:hypothetical protein